MPSTATITAVNTFVANTRAKAAEVNTNFSNLRGHMIPIEPLTATSSHLTHDLGSSDHAWRVGYMQKLNIRAATITAAFIIQGNTTVTAGAADFLFDSTTIASFDLNGMKRQSLETASNLMTTSAGGTGAVSYSLTASTWIDVTALSTTISIKKSMVEISLFEDNTGAAGMIDFLVGVSGTVVNLDLRIVRDTTTSIVNGANSATRLRQGNYSSGSFGWQASQLRWIDDPGAGSYTYKLQASPGAGNQGTVTFNYIKMRVREL